MSDQRHEERRKLMSFTPVYDLHTKTLLGYLGDLTLKGAMIVGETPEEIDKRITIGIEFHETVETPATRMVIPVRVAWCKRDGSSTFYNTGIEFLELSDDNTWIIKAILERFQFRREPEI